MTTRQTVSGTGSPQNVVLEFDYINQSHVKVSVNGTPLAYSWVNPTTVQFTATSGQQVTVYRETPKDAPLVEFSSTNSVGSPELNLVARQALFAAQEVQDVADEAVIEGLAGKSDVGHGHANATTVAPGFMSSADKTKLNGISDGATANDTDAELRDRSTHTGTQSADTISDLSERIQDVVGALLVGGSNINISYNDASNTLVISATGELAVNWDLITGKPTLFPPQSHGHVASDVSYANGGTALVATTTQAAITELDADLSAAITSLTGSINGKANASHGHAISDITSLQTTLDGKLSTSGGAVTGPLTLPGGTLFAKQSDPNEGGEWRLQLSSGATLAGGQIIGDISGNNFRLFEDGGSFRGIFWPLASAGAGVGSEGTTSLSLGAHLAALATAALGQHCFALHVSAAIGYGTTVAGSDLRASSHVANSGTTINNGSWRCHGQTTGAGQATLYQRVA